MQFIVRAICSLPTVKHPWKLYLADIHSALFQRALFPKMSRKLSNQLFFYHLQKSISHKKKYWTLHSHSFTFGEHRTIWYISETRKKNCLKCWLVHCTITIAFKFDSCQLGAIRIISIVYWIPTDSWIHQQAAAQSLMALCFCQSAGIFVNITPEFVRNARQRIMHRCVQCTLKYRNITSNDSWSLKRKFVENFAWNVNELVHVHYLN